MQLDAAQILRQSIASTTFDAAPSGAQKAGSPVESGVAMGFGVQVMSDPTAELMDSMEELSFQFEEKEAKEISERKLGDARRAPNAQIEAIQSWMKMMPDMPGADFIRRMLRLLHAAQPPPGAEQLLKMLGEGSGDPSHQFAMLDCLEKSLAEGEAELRQAVQDAKAQLERTKGPEMRAGINVAEEINKRVSTPEEMHDLRELYRGEVVGFSSPQHCFRSLLASRGAGHIAEALEFLISAAGVDLQAANPSQSAEQLRSIISDLQCVEVLRTVMDRLDRLVARLLNQFGERSLLDGEKLTGRVVDLTEQPFVSSAQVGGIMTSCGIRALLAQMDFAREMLAVFRELSPRLFAEAADRFKLTAAAQELLEETTDRLAEEEEKEAEKRRREERRQK